ncbi:hypothetical protein [Halorubellus salinus]|uniref:hypothetical protein n=1 Tax=Halorubellus salinus TaxID=755309 RepID=UPI001D06F017|nr:hypothetical protein [Halorubellus salinus]
MNIAGYEFKEVTTGTEELPSKAVGVYVVVCVISGRPHCVLYIGTSEGGVRADVTPSGNLQHTLETHKKRDCWEENAHGEIGYFIKSVTDDERRTAIRNELQWKFITPCGVDPWDAPQTGDDWEEYRESFGPRGSESI